ncbi:MAG TPA: hypothetical protein VGN14_01100, partial [Candidatus Elarobacter sp.]
FAKREADLIGATLRAGTTVLTVVDTNKRCVTTTYDIATGESEPRVLSEVAQRRANVVGIYCEVITPGVVTLADVLRLD